MIFLLRFEEDDFLPLYDGCVVMGGVLKDAASLKSYLRKRFCNDRLFLEKGEDVAFSSQSFKTSEKYSLLSKLSLLVGSQRRDEFEPVLLSSLNVFCNCIGEKEGTKLCVESPYFTCIGYCFPCSNNEEFVYVGYCQWACGICWKNGNAV